MRPDLDPPEQPLVRAAEDAHAGGVQVRGEEQVVLLVDEHAGHSRQIRERAQERARRAVEYVDAVGARVRDVHSPAGAVDVGVVEAGFRAGRQSDEAGANEAHAVSALHQA